MHLHGRGVAVDYGKRDRQRLDVRQRVHFRGNPEYVVTFPVPQVEHVRRTIEDHRPSSGVRYDPDAVAARAKWLAIDLHVGAEADAERRVRARGPHLPVRHEGTKKLASARHRPHIPRTNFSAPDHLHDLGALAAAGRLRIRVRGGTAEEAEQGEERPGKGEKGNGWDTGPAKWDVVSHGA